MPFRNTRLLSAVLRSIPAHQLCWCAGLQQRAAENNNGAAENNDNAAQRNTGVAGQTLVRGKQVYIFPEEKPSPDPRTGV